MTQEDRIDIFEKHYWPIISPACSNDTKDILLVKGFFDAPASMKYHGNYPGGLCDHSYNVINSLAMMTDRLNLKWLRPESPYIIGLFHDLCKCDQYKPVFANWDPRHETIDHYEYNNETLLKGHGEKSVMVAAQICCLTEEEVACIRYHMGAFTEKEQWSDYTGAIHRWPNVLYTHHADMIASHIMEID